MSGLDNVVVVAGAGTGKTHALVTEYLSTLLGIDGAGRGVVSPERVLAITFTDKAAAEMRRRVAVRLSALARGPSGDDEMRLRAEQVGATLPPQAVLERLHRHLAAAPIQTFHALAQSLLREHALDAHVDPGFELLDAVDERALLVEQTEAAVIDRLRMGDAETAELAARLKLRGFGTGRGLVDGVADVYERLAERGLSPLDLPLASDAEQALERVATTRRALSERVSALVLRLVEDERTRHARDRADAVARHHTALEDALAASRAPDDDDTHLAAAFRALDLELRVPVSRALEDARVDTRRTLAFLGAAIVDRSAAPLAAAVKSLLVEVERKVRSEKDARGVLGFGDLLVRARDLLRGDGIVRARVKARFERVLVDEFQDTSPVQADLVALLCEEPTRQDRVLLNERAMGVLRLARGRLFVVGDPKQSIYGFRGADVDQFAHTERLVVEGSDALAPTGVRRVLRESRRSRAPLCDLVNTVSRATLEARGGGPLPDDELLSALRPGDGPAGALVSIRMPRDGDADELEPLVVAREIQAMLDAALPVDDDGRPCRPRDIAVLLRRVRPAAPIARALIRAGIPAQVTGGEGFFARPEVVDVVAALRLLIEADDELAGLAVMRSPFVGLSDDALLALAARDRHTKRPFSMARALSRLDDAEIAPDERARLRDFAQLLERQRGRIARVPLGDIIDALIDDGGYAVAVGAESDAFERLANLNKLRVIAEGRPGDAVAIVSRLWDFLDDPPREGVAQAGGADADAVRIMTIHQAKGLEFPIVVVADAGSPLYRDSPDITFGAEIGLAVTHRGRAIAECVSDDIDHDDARPAIARATRQAAARDERELARILYVALTRARDHVLVVGEERKAGAPSLRRLLERARASDAKEMARLFPVRRVDVAPPEERALPTSHDVLVPLAAPARVVSLVRREPSSLVPDDDATPSPSSWRTSRDARARGQLVHALVARAAEALVDEGAIDDENIVRHVDAAVRGLGEDAREPMVVAAAELARVTIAEAVRPLVDAGYALSFEEPLLARVAVGEADREVVLQGVADVVARGPLDTLVIDFKSSARAAEHRATRLQLAAYASALVAREERPVRIMAGVFGAALDPREATPVDDALLNELRASLERATETPSP